MNKKMPFHICLWREEKDSRKCNTDRRCLISRCLIKPWIMCCPYTYLCMRTVWHLETIHISMSILYLLGRTSYA